MGCSDDIYGFESISGCHEDIGYTKAHPFMIPKWMIW